MSILLWKLPCWHSWQFFFSSDRSRDAPTKIADFSRWLIKRNFQKSNGRKVSIYQIYYKNNIVYLRAEVLLEAQGSEDAII